jgi:hypothetical protein
LLLPKPKAHDTHVALELILERHSVAEHERRVGQGVQSLAFCLGNACIQIQRHRGFDELLPTVHG